PGPRCYDIPTREQNPAPPPPSSPKASSLHFVSPYDGLKGGGTFAACASPPPPPLPFRAARTGL
uniref:Uncharacterized protein n=2 Tax=Ixodes scapularis TaxID=6945 RepID=A0A1S4LCF7_IXOSC